MITAQPVVDPLWPDTEASAYVDWWTEAEMDGGTREISAHEKRDGIGFVTFFAVPPAGGTGFAVPPAGGTGALRYRPGQPPAGVTAARRRMPMWPGALPPKAGNDPSPDQMPDGAPLEQKRLLVEAPVSEFGAPLPAVADPPPAVMVIIDTQINPLHEQFRNADGTPRIVAHWLMESAWRADGRVPFGRELRGDDLSCACRMPTEDAGLRRLKVVDFTRPFAARDAFGGHAHGTHVLALAAGTRPHDTSTAAQALRKVPILAVSLPSNRLLSASGVFLDVFVDQALEWVAQRLAQMFPGGLAPVVVNLSYGLAAGPKDGSGYLNNRLRSWLETIPQARLFMPSGNDGLAQGHAVLTAGGGQSSIGWLVPPADPLSTFAEVWFETDDPQTRLELTPPDRGGVVSLPLQAGAVFDLIAGHGPQARTIGRAYMMRGETAGKPVGCLVCLAPTRPRRAGRPAAPAGMWQIGVTGGRTRASVTLQSERSLTAHSRASPAARLVTLAPTGAQPQRNGTLNAIGPLTGARMVNGYDEAIRAHMAKFGAAGCRNPTVTAALSPSPPLLGEALARWTSRGDPQAAPSTEDGVAFVADRSRARPGIRAPGALSGSTATVEGTSFSTALASRCALVRLAMAP